MNTTAILASDFSGLAFERLFYYGLGLLVALVTVIGVVWLIVRLLRRK
jgi:flagellar biogenesis protein FliO